MEAAWNQRAEMHDKICGRKHRTTKCHCAVCDPAHLGRANIGEFGCNCVATPVAWGYILWTIVIEPQDIGIDRKNT